MQSDKLEIRNKQLDVRITSSAFSVGMGVASDNTLSIRGGWLTAKCLSTPSPSNGTTSASYTRSYAPLWGISYLG